MVTRPVIFNLGSGQVNIEQWSYNNKYINTQWDIYHIDRNPGSYDTYKEFDNNGNIHYHIKEDVFKFLENTCLRAFDVRANRIFEHLDYTSGEIGYLLELLNRKCQPRCNLSIIVPNAMLLAKNLLNYEKNNNMDIVESQKTKLILNTEFCNCKGDPHLSIWTPKLAREYIESEGTWKIASIENKITYASRSIYMKINCLKEGEGL
jgi:hypothetical protein